jgi:DegV family protein with EDD domain
MAEKIAIIVDSGSDVPQAVLQQHKNIKVVPLTVTFGSENYQDSVDISPDEFYTRLESSTVLPSTASPAPFAAQSAMQKLLDDGYDHILGITIAGALSSTQQSFKLAAAAFPTGTVEVLDSRSVGIGSGLQAAYALDLIAAGITFAELIQKVSASITRSRVYFYIPTLEYLQAGGRIGRVAGLVGSVLKIKPVISCAEDGVYYTVSKARSEAKAVGKMIAEAAKVAAGAQHVSIAVAHGHNPELLQSTCVQLAEVTGLPVNYTGDVSPALGVHTGPGLVGITVQVAD